MNTDITVVLTVFNQSESSLEKSIKSVAAQRECSFQFVIADDHSDVDPSVVIEALCSQYGLDCYELIRHEQNLKTIGNILNTKSVVRGRYVKVLGAGDALYDEHTLRDIVDFCDAHDVKAGFGNIVKENDGLLFAAPRNANAYPPQGKATRKELFSHQIETADWIPGCAQFFRTDVLYELLDTLYSEYGIRYCEDFAELIALEQFDVFHLDRDILLYEVGAGISTTGNIQSRKRLYADHTALYETIARRRPFGRPYVLGRLSFDARKFVALKTPVYGIFQKMLMSSYSKQHDDTSPEKSTVLAQVLGLTPSEFLGTAFSFAWTRLFHKNATLIRKPFYVRGNRAGLKLGDGFTCGRGSRVELFGNGKIVLGAQCHFGDFNHLVASSSVTIGNNCLFASKVFVSDTSHGSYGADGCDPSSPPNDRPLVSKPVTIGDNVWLGENVVVLSGVTIGDGCIIGANSTVTRDIEPNTIAAGSPAVPIKVYDSDQGSWIKTE